MLRVGPILNPGHSDLDIHVQKVVLREHTFKSGETELVKHIEFQLVVNALQSRAKRVTVNCNLMFIHLLQEDYPSEGERA